MALEEITTGMSNAAEVINSNFENGSVVESGTNVNGSFIKYGDGTVIAYSDSLTMIYDSSSRLSYLWTLPTAFTGAYTAVVTGSKDSEHLGDNINTAMLNIGSNSASSIVLSRAYATGSNSFTQSTVCRIRLIAVGRWN